MKKINFYLIIPLLLISSSYSHSNDSFEDWKVKFKILGRDFLSESLSEEETKSVIKEIYEKEKILIDPHTAVAIGVANKISSDDNVVVLGTAHPAKFSDVVMKETNIKPDLPEKLKKILNQKERIDKLPNDLKKVKDYIMDRA